MAAFFGQVLTEAQLTNFTQRLANLEIPVIQLELPPNQVSCTNRISAEDPLRSRGPCRNSSYIQEHGSPRTSNRSSTEVCVYCPYHFV